MVSKRLSVLKIITCCIGLLVIAPTLVSASFTATSATLPVAGDVFPIADVHPNTEDYVSVAYDEARRQYLVVNTNDGALNATCMRDSGVVVGTYVVGNAGVSDVAYNPIDDQYMVVYADADLIKGNTIAGSCCLQVGCVGVPFTISSGRPATSYHYKPAIAYNQHAANHDYMVVWSDYRIATNNYFSVYARRVNADRSFDTLSFAVADDSLTFEESYEPDVAYNLNHNEWLIVYTRDPGGPGSTTDIYGRRYFATGDALENSEEPIDSSSDDQRHPAVAAYRLNMTTPYLVVFTDYWNDSSGDVRGYLVNVDGSPNTLVSIAALPGVTEQRPDIAVSEALGGYTVVWEQINANLDIYARRAKHNGLMGETYHVSLPAGQNASTTHEQFSAVAGGSPTTLVVWEQYGNDYDVYGRFLGYRVYVPLTVRMP